MSSGEGPFLKTEMQPQRWNSGAGDTVKTGTFRCNIVVAHVPIKLTLFLALLLCAQSGVVAAQSAGKFPGVPLDNKTLRVQAKAEALFEERNYERAYFIYRKELSPIGDKYAQYMVGYMHMTGKSVPEDRVTASAWYRLAAERGTPEFLRVRDQLLVSLTPEQRARSDREFIEIRKQYGDLVLLLKALRADHATLRSRTGSRLGQDSSPLVVIDMRRQGSSASGVEYYGQIEKRIQSRLEYIAGYTDIEIIDLDANSVDLTAIEQQVNARLETLD